MPRPLDKHPGLRSPPHPQELEEAYQDAASNVLVAICRHSWRPVAQHLEAEVLTGVFPHRSLLYVMGVLTSKRTSCRGSRGPGHPLPPPWPGEGGQVTERHPGRGWAAKHVRGRGQWAADPAPHSPGRWDPAKERSVQLGCPLGPEAGVSLG